MRFPMEPLVSSFSARSVENTCDSETARATQGTTCPSSAHHLHLFNCVASLLHFTTMLNLAENHAEITQV